MTVSHLADKTQQWSEQKPEGGSHWPVTCPTSSLPGCASAGGGHELTQPSPQTVPQVSLLGAAPWQLAPAVRDEGDTLARQSRSAYREHGVTPAALAVFILLPWPQRCEHLGVTGPHSLSGGFSGTEGREGKCCAGIWRKNILARAKALWPDCAWLSGAALGPVLPSEVQRRVQGKALGLG